MSDPDDMDALAAEFVLGTLDPSERKDVAERRDREPALNAALEAWEQRFGPLAETVPSVAPPGELFGKIEARLEQALAPVSASATAPEALKAPHGHGDSFARIEARLDRPSTPALGGATAPQPPGNVIDLQARLGRWRRRALGFGLLAACLTAGIGLREWTRPAVQKTYVAVLQKDAASIAFLLSVDLETRAFTIRPVAAQPEPGKSFELWLVDSKLGPKSLGVVGDQPATTRASLGAYDRMTLAGATYAVSVEPSGGSPTGAPTGPVVFTGQLVQTGP